MKRLLMTGAVAGAIAAGATMTVLPYGDVRLKGPMGERLNKMIEHHLKATDVDYITAQTWPRGWFHIPKDPDFPVPS